MDVQKLTHEVRLQQWSKTVKDCRSSGKSVKSWCDGQNINIKTYYYWQKKVCQATCRELAMPPQPSIAVNAPPIPVFAELRKSEPPWGQLALAIRKRKKYRHLDKSQSATVFFTLILST